MSLLGIYRKLTGNSYGNAAAVGIAAGGLAYAGWRPLVSLGAALARPVVALANGGSLPRGYDRDVEELKGDLKARLVSSGSVMFLSSLLALAADYRANERGGGLGSYEAPEEYAYSNRISGAKSPSAMRAEDEYIAAQRKQASADFLAMQQAVPDVDYGKVVSVSDIDRLMYGDPFLSDMDYARNSAVAIVHGAGNAAGSGTVTYGNIFDSAMDKFDRKLSFGGVADVAARTAIANGMSNLFVGALGTMMDVPENVRNNLVSAGTWAGALNAIFN